VDIGLLYLPLTNEAIQAGYEFYEMWYEAPGAVKVGPTVVTRDGDGWGRGGKAEAEMSAWGDTVHSTRMRA
jgi:hypothetical protein